MSIAEHAVRIISFIVVLFAGFGIVGIRMTAVEKLDNVEPAFVYIEMDVPCFKVGSAGLPDLRIRIETFNFLPGSCAGTLAVCCWRDKQQIQKVMLRLTALMNQNLNAGKKEEKDIRTKEFAEELTEREQEICTLMVEGLTNRQIADKLYISEGTVKNYISNIYDKTGIHDRVKLIVELTSER